MRPEVAKRLCDAHGACVAIETFVQGVDQAGFLASALIRSAVERQFEIIGEALGRAMKVDEGLAERVPELVKIVGLRNRLIHGYDSVDEQIVWDIVQTKLPVLREVLADELNNAGFGSLLSP